MVRRRSKLRKQSSRRSRKQGSRRPRKPRSKRSRHRTKGGDKYLEGQLTKMAKIFADESYDMLNKWMQEITILRIKFLKLRRHFDTYPDSATRLTDNWKDFLNQVSNLKKYGTVTPANTDPF
jgi:hypothetical protein